MPAYEDQLPPTLIKGLALYISEQRQQFPTTADSYQKTQLQDRVVETSHHRFLFRARY